MGNSVFIKNLYTKCRIHGSGEAQVAISDGEIYALIVLTVYDLNWSFDELGIEQIYQAVSAMPAVSGAAPSIFSAQANNKAGSSDGGSDSDGEVVLVQRGASKRRRRAAASDDDDDDDEDVIVLV